MMVVLVVVSPQAAGVRGEETPVSETPRTPAACG